MCIVCIAFSIAEELCVRSQDSFFAVRTWSAFLFSHMTGAQIVHLAAGQHNRTNSFGVPVPPALGQNGNAAASNHDSHLGEGSKLCMRLCVYACVYMCVCMRVYT